MLLLLSLLAYGEEPEAPPEDDWGGAYEVTVIGDSPRDVENVPGSAAVVTEEDLDRYKPLSAGEALQSVAGVVVQGEEGLGLRQNIGVRGLNPNRSRKVLVLEDGVPISLAPYGEPEMYYVPPIERMERIEVVKGSGSILFGPQTIGGVVNYITPDPPEDLEVSGEVRGGPLGHGQGLVEVGDTIGRFGYRVSAFHQRFDGPRNLGVVRTDVTGKTLLRLGEGHTLVAKGSFYDETSASTYLGLTTPQFETDPQASFAIHDDFDVRRFGLAVTHGLLLGGRTSVTTRIYGHHVSRGWWRQDFDRSDAGYDYERVIDGKGQDVTDNPDLWPTDGSGIFFRDSTAERLRIFTVGGIEPRVTTELGNHHVQAGLRLHAEHTDEQRIQGEQPEARTGEVTDEAERLGTALAAYALDRVDLLDGRLQVSPGVRLESLWTRQEIRRMRVSGEPTDLDPALEVREHVWALLPGLGVAWHTGPDTTLFAGVHRGFAPPRTKDAVTTDGDVLRLDAEHSWNYELGGRVSREGWLSGEAALFLLDFRNQVIPPNEAGGAVADDTVNGGSTLHAGAEASVRVDPTRGLGLEVSTPLTVSATFVRATFRDGWGLALDGQTLPYAPAFQVFAAAGLAHPIGLSGQVKGTWTGAQYADRVETVDASVDGLVGRIGPHLVLDAQLGWEHDESGLSAHVAVKNLLDHPYIASRSPRGIQPGLPRTVFGGIGWSF